MGFIIVFIHNRTIKQEMGKCSKRIVVSLFSPFNAININIYLCCDYADIIDTMSRIVPILVIVLILASTKRRQLL